MRCCDIINIIEKMWPIDMAEEWDNVGLLIGRVERNIHKILVCLDVTMEVIDEAIDMNVDMIIAHHPIIFNSIKSVTDLSLLGAKLIKIIGNDICVYSMHTNYDSISMAKLAGDRLSLIDCEILIPTGEMNEKYFGLGSLGTLGSGIKLGDYVNIVKAAFNIDDIRLYGNPESNIERIAIFPGSGKSAIKVAIEKGADLLITGDISHHDGIDAIDSGLAIMDASHYGIEKLFIEDVSNVLMSIIGDIDIIVDRDRSPYRLV